MKDDDNVILSYLGTKWGNTWYMNEVNEDLYMRTRQQCYLLVTGVNREDLIDEIIASELERKVKE